MALFSDGEQTTADALARLAFANPFLPERIAFEREVLGPEFVALAADWNVRVDSGAVHPNLSSLERLVDRLVDDVHGRLVAGTKATERERSAYESLVLLLLYYRYRHEFHDLIQAAVADPDATRHAPFYDAFVGDAKRLLSTPDACLFDPAELPHIFAIYYQIRRAFFEIFSNIIGVSSSIIRLRAMVWQSLFSHDMQRYRRVLYRHTGDITTLITGPSGTGKELVARAIALSRYIPFDPKTRSFPSEYTSLFHALNITALSPTLVESELFGHKRGSFTGAVSDRTGWLDECTELGTVFLDEIGDLDRQIQVKLLRVLQTRAFQPIGAVETRHFRGKLIAATNRELEREMAEGRFRTDFYYRLCADMITTPTLQQQIEDSPAQLHTLVFYLSHRMVGDEEAELLAREVEDWIERSLGLEYDWPGNVRELEQCVCNVMVRKEYHPLRVSRRGPRERIGREVAGGELTLDELVRRYCTIVYAQTGSYEQTAERLGIDRRTVKSRIDRELLERLESDAEGS